MALGWSLWRKIDRMWSIPGAEFVFLSEKWLRELRFQKWVGYRQLEGSETS